jgi:hypothetical protein
LARSLKLQFASEFGASGRAYSSYHLSNTGSSACELTQLRLTYLGASGAVVKAIDNSALPSVLSLAAGGVATLTISDLTGCASPVAASRLSVVPSGAPAGVSIGVTAQACAPTANTLAPGAS